MRVPTEPYAGPVLLRLAGDDAVGIVLERHPRRHQVRRSYLRREARALNVWSESSTFAYFERTTQSTSSLHVHASSNVRAHAHTCTHVHTLARPLENDTHTLTCLGVKRGADAQSLVGCLGAGPSHSAVPLGACLIEILGGR